MENEKLWIRQLKKNASDSAANNLVSIDREGNEYLSHHFYLKGVQLMEITLAEPIELIDIVEIDKEVIGSNNRKDYLKKAIEENKCLVAKKDSVIVGFLIYNTDFFDCSFIALVIVHPLERNKGFAKSMMEYFEKVSPTQKVFSSTNQSNENMQKLFVSIGYVKSGYVENLDEGDPEIIYYKNICMV